MYPCIAMYQYSSLTYQCITVYLSMNCFLQWIIEKIVVRKTLYSMVIVMDFTLAELPNCFQLASNDRYAMASNTFKQ